MTEQLTDDKLREAIGRAWCHEENVTKEMDVDLAEAVLWEIRELTRAAPVVTDAMVEAALLTTLGRNWPTKETMRAALERLWR